MPSTEQLEQILISIVLILASFAVVVRALGNTLPQQWPFTKFLKELAIGLKFILPPRQSLPPSSPDRVQYGSLAPPSKPVAYLRSGSWILLTLALIAFGLLFFTGCQGSFEEARTAANAPAFRLGTPSIERCQTLSDREQTWGTVAQVSGALVLPTGLAIIPVKSEGAEAALAATTVGAGAIAAGSLYASKHSATSYIREGCGQPPAND